MLKLGPCPLRLPTLHSGSSPALPFTLLRLPTKCTRTFNFREIFKHAFKIYGIWPQANKHVHIHTLPQCSPASVGLAQAHPNYSSYESFSLILEMDCINPERRTPTYSYVCWGSCVLHNCISNCTAVWWLICRIMVVPQSILSVGLKYQNKHLPNHCLLCCQSGQLL